MYDAERDYLATDYVKARVQGLDPDDFYKWNETYIRLSDVSTQSVTAFDSKQYDDFKEVLFADRSIDYIPVGAYIETMGSVWLVVNPSNMGTATTNTVIARCRTHYNFYDAYGNILSEPLVVDRRSMLSNRRESPSNIELPEGYFNVKCQLNENTAKINDNTRFILGRNAYHVTGLTDFFEEFTFDNESVHIITFTIRREEPQVNDDMVNRIADGLLCNFGFSINVPLLLFLKQGAEIQLEPRLTLNGDIVPSTAENPQKWIYTYSGSKISISEDGLLKAIGSTGTHTVTVTLEQNPNISEKLRVTLTSAPSSRYSVFIDAPETITQYSSALVTGSYEIDNIKQEDPLEWEFAEADPSTYSAVIAENGREVTITCLSPSTTALKVTATYNGSHHAARSKTIKLEGY
jgi:hypothetical protein